VSAPRSGHNGMAQLPTWAELEPMVPAIVATMRRYLQQIACVLRPGSVGGADLALRSFAAFLVQCAPDVSSFADLVRVRIDEWGWPEAPVRVPMFNGDLPRQDHPLPKALDDAAAAKLLRAAQADRKLLVRVTVDVLLRTGLRVSEYTTLRADAVVQIGAAPWLHVPVGKLHDDRYLPLHPKPRGADRRLPCGARAGRPSAAAAAGERPRTRPAHRHPVH
jgi:integrase